MGLPSVQVDPTRESYYRSRSRAPFVRLRPFHFFRPVHLGHHLGIIFSSAASVCDLFLLLFHPFLVPTLCSTRGALWWITKNAHQIHSIRVVNGAFALVVAVLCLEIRVVFHSFGRYIQVPPPLNYLLVTLTMLGGAAGAGAYALGMISDAFSSVAFTALTVIVSAAGAIVVGFPILARVAVLEIESALERSRIITLRRIRKLRL
ncbi:hypothetical protein GH714_007256 [Hevea brasiliensis]|uniref:Uncharacterized protein n=1 Tax=Hevea brasiliensis TaxID=3981 RepID=A0A6A6KJA9_HEVBR|nr:hypothetical protein GH714_007256 [Hevea brasiliensis]